MAKVPERHTDEEAPLYVRWNPDRSAFAIEMRLDLVARAGAEIERANRLNLETGGVLIGSVVNSAVPTLSIDDFIPIPRQPGDGQVFMLNPDEHERFARTRWRDLPPGKTAVGFFRSHLRSGPLKPSIADRGLLSEHFRDVYVLLLVEGRESNRAAFFVAANRELPDQPSVREFRFTEEAFRALPEVQPEESLEAAAAAPERREAVAWRPWWAVLFALVLFACAAIVWEVYGNIGVGTGPAKLSITSTGPVLKISWNHTARDVTDANQAILLIDDGNSRRKITLGQDDLLLGAVDCQKSGTEVTATLRLTQSSGNVATETAHWPKTQ